MWDNLSDDELMNMPQSVLEMRIALYGIVATVTKQSLSPTLDTGLNRAIRILKSRCGGMAYAADSKSAAL